jgi:hypothetical protein
VALKLIFSPFSYKEKPIGLGESQGVAGI